MHIRRKYRMPNSIEVQEFNSSKCPGTSKPRGQRSEKTPEQIAKANQRRKQRECSRMVETYFNEDDGSLTLTFRKELRPKDMKEAVKIFGKFTRWLKREYQKRFYDLMWIRNIEVGPRGGWHIHIILNRIEGMEMMINDWWTANFGGVYIQYLKNWKDQGKDIGEYIAKTKLTSDEVVETSWGHSRNIHKVKPEDKVISGQRMTDQPRVPAGWYLDKDSYYEGENENGYRFRTYTFRRIQKRRIDHRLTPKQIGKLKRKKVRRK